MMPRPLIIEELTMAEFEEGLAATRTMLIPFGSVEEHGNHLPLSTDTIQAYEVGKKAASIIPLFVAPPVHYGNCRSTSNHPGTISISTGTVKSLLHDIVRSGHRQGLRNFMVLSGHAGGAHVMALQDAGEELLREFSDAWIAVLVEFELARKAGLGIIETTDDRHAGEIETSRILHSHPHMVKGRASEEYPAFPAGILVRDKRKYWPNGVWGNPGKATAKKGKMVEEAVVAQIVDMVRMIENYK
jgi:creatinine amidohydrolase